MANAIWTALTVAAMAGMFAGCVVVVVVGVRGLENALARRGRRPAA
jgi:hypothetical protein